MLWRISPARSRRTPRAGFIRPCQPLLVAHPPAGPGWRHEVKHDGYRIVARKQGERVMLWSRYGADFTDRLLTIAEAVRGLPAENALVDGEAVAFRPDGRSDFGALRTKAGGAEACLVAFDLLGLDGEDVRQCPLEERRDRLSGLVRGVDGVVFSEVIEGEGAVGSQSCAVDSLRAVRPTWDLQCGAAHGAARRRQADRSASDARQLPEGALG